MLSQKKKLKRLAEPPASRVTMAPRYNQATLGMVHHVISATSDHSTTDSICNTKNCLIRSRCCVSAFNSVFVSHSTGFDTMIGVLPKPKAPACPSG